MIIAPISTSIPRFVNVWTAMFMAEVKCPKSVIAMIDEGQIRFAINIGLSQRNREIRILNESVLEYLGRRTPETGDFEKDWQSTVDRMFPSSQAYVTGIRLQELFLCGTTHISNLIHSGEIRIAKGTRIFRGALGTPRVERSSLVAFLARRRLV